MRAHLPGKEAHSGAGRRGGEGAQERLRIEARFAAEEVAAARGRGERRFEGRKIGAVEPLGGDAEADQPGEVGLPGRRLGLAEDDAQGAVGAIGEVDAGRRLELRHEAGPAAHRVLGEREERSAVLRLDAGREDPACRARSLALRGRCVRGRSPARPPARAAGRSRSRGSRRRSRRCRCSSTRLLSSSLRPGAPKIPAPSGAAHSPASDSMLRSRRTRNREFFNPSAPLRA